MTPPPRAGGEPRAARRPAARERRGDRVALAYAKLRELIVRGRLAPGSRIIETDVATRLGVSRTPVRGALQRLQQEGYIMASGHGAQSRLSVAPLTREDAQELFGIVAQVEGLAARWAAELQPEPRAELDGRLESLNRSLLDEATRPHPDQQRLFEIDQEFHRSFVEAGGGPRLRALHDAIKPQSERYIRLYVSALVDEIDKSVREHAVVLQAIRRGEPDDAEFAVRENWRNAVDRLCRVIDDLGERGAW